jgi:hypothetical protein
MATAGGGRQPSVLQTTVGTVRQQGVDQHAQDAAFGRVADP